ncbi:hypothetical protein N9E93_03840 [Oceanospirillaceae bacterium]|nr:hypothetical protein [Oceanospirillaceae bacterium]
MTNQYFLFEDISSKWLEMAKEAKFGQEIFIFSPFITGNLIVDISKVTSDKSLFVITSLSPSAYLGGSLDVDILTNLLSKGIPVFHLTNLHAKLMLVGSNLTVGSQNFTEGGKHNVESSIVCDISKKQLENLEGKITDILKKAYAISEAMLVKFICDCEKLREQYDETQKLLDAVDNEIEQYVETEVKRRNPGLQEVEVIKADYEKDFASIPIQVHEVEYYNYDKWIDYKEYLSYFTLKSSESNKVLNIFFRSDPKESEDHLEYLENQKRYLCFELKNLQLFWICANKKQIGKFSQGLETDWQIPGTLGNISIFLQNPYEAEDFANIKIQFDTQEYGQISIGVFFSGVSFILKSYANMPKDKPVAVIKDWTIVWPLLIEPIMTELPSQILTPFEFRSKNTGESPNRLFEADKEMKLGLQKYEDKLFYILDDA